MKPARFFGRSAVLLFWAAFAGVVYSAVTSGGNFIYLGWPSLLFLVAVFMPVIYAACVLTPKLWRYE